MSRYEIFIGSFSKDENAAILRCRMNGETGEIKVVGRTPARRPSWIELNGEKDRLISISETDDFKGCYGGGAEIYQVNDEELSLMSSIAIGARGPTHFCFNEKLMIAACYSEGAIVRMKLNKDAFSGEAELIRHSGASVHPIRQNKPHPHFAAFTKDGNQLLVCDLGTDEIILYPADGEGNLGKAQKFCAPKGSGPRHAAFSADGRFVYVVTELDCSVLTFSCTSEGLKLIQAIKPPKAAGLEPNQCGAIKINGNGNELMVTNRGPDSISFYSINKEGLLTYEGDVPTANHPREAVISPDGNLILSLGLKSCDVWVYSYSNDTSRPLSSRVTLLKRNSLPDGSNPSALAFGKALMD